MWVFFVSLVLFYLGLAFIDKILHDCQCLPYFCLLQKLGLSIHPFQIRWFTSAFNRRMSKWANPHSNAQRVWFTSGVVVVLSLTLPAIVLLVVNIVRWFSTPPTTHRHDDLLLQPMVPGLTLQGWHIVAYGAVLGMSSVLHELGHAVAAYREGVRPDGVGMQILLVIPMAFVALPARDMAALAPWPRLRVMCAGAWHNVAQTALALGLALALPTLLAPLYAREAYVAGLTEGSTAGGPTGLQPGDAITAVNGCGVSTLHEWHDCLLAAATHPQRGYCVPDSRVAALDETAAPANGPGGSVLCCPARPDRPHDHLCFELLSPEDADYDSVPMHPFACLPARAALSVATGSCRTTSDCRRTHFCLAPSLPAETRLVAISRRPKLQVVWPDVDLQHGKRRLTAAVANYTASHRSPVALAAVKTADTAVDTAPEAAPDAVNATHNSTDGSKTTGSVEEVSITDNAVPKVINTDTKRSKRALLASSPINVQPKDLSQPRRRSADEDDDDHTNDVASSFTDVLFLGSPADLYQTVHVTDYAPRHAYVPTYLPTILLYLCDYIVKLAGALALLNMVPGYGLDGQYICDAVLEHLLLGKMALDDVQAVSCIIMFAGSVLLAANVGIALYSAL